ncbi:MAG: DUF7309 domain-containing protein, partial [Turicibacter sp.]
MNQKLINLYEAAIEFKKLKPWNWIVDEQIFVIKEP